MTTEERSNFTDAEWIKVLKRQYDELEAESERYKKGLEKVIALGTCDRFRDGLFDGCENRTQCPTCLAEYALRGMVLHEVEQNPVIEVRFPTEEIRQRAMTEARKYRDAYLEWRQTGHHISFGPGSPLVWPCTCQQLTNDTGWCQVVAMYTDKLHIQMKARPKQHKIANIVGEVVIG